LEEALAALEAKESLDFLSLNVEVSPLWKRKQRYRKEGVVSHLEYRAPPE